MEQVKRWPMPGAKKWSNWKRPLFDGVLAIMPVLLVTVIIFAFHLYTHFHATLLVYLLLILGLAYKRGFRIVIPTVFATCIFLDFFLIKPTFSFTVSNIDDGLDLLIFPIVAIPASYLVSWLRKRAEEAKRQEYEASRRYEERLRQETEEVNYRERLFYDVVRATREEKNLKYQLGLIAQSVVSAFASCGIRSCDILLPDLDGKPSLQTHPTQPTNLTILSLIEEASVIWVMEHAESLIVPNIPLISRDKGSYLRRVVASTVARDSLVKSYSYIIPLMSEQKVVGVLHLFIEDDANLELAAIKQYLKAEHGSSNLQAELFSKLLDHAVSLIKQALIEQALRQQESLRKELWQRTEELHASIISSVSHDLHTPLTLIKGAASNLLDQATLWSDEAERRRTLEAVVSEANWLERIVTRLLSLSSIEQGALKLEKELYPIDEIILTTLDLGHMQTLIQGRVIEKNVPDELPPVEIDPILITQVLANLIENAIHYTPPESPIEISVQADGRQMLISVADRGPGIPPTDIDCIFEKFYRVKRKIEAHASKTSANCDSAFQNQGIGLGLAVCRGFVEAHQGRIWVRNRDIGGAEFLFTLPLSQAQG